MDPAKPTNRTRKVRITVDIGQIITDLFDRGIRPSRIEYTPHSVTIILGEEPSNEPDAFQG